jgi:hypothetical protein
MTAQANVQFHTVLPGAAVQVIEVDSPDKTYVNESRRCVREGQKQEEVAAKLLSEMAAEGRSDLTVADAAKRYFRNAVVNYQAAERFLTAALDHNLSPGKRSFIETKIEYITFRQAVIRESAGNIAAYAS